MSRFSQGIASEAFMQECETVLASCLAPRAQYETDLAAVVRAWSELTEAVKAGIVAVRALLVSYPPHLRHHGGKGAAVKYA